MLAELMPKLAGFEKEGRGTYRPRPSLAGPDRCIRQMAYWSQDYPEDKQIGDRFILTMDDSSWHEHLTADWIRKSAYTLHSEQMGVNCMTLNFLPPSPPRHCDICKRSEDDNVYPLDIPNNVLHGHIDGILQDITGKDIHYEHKGINRFTFERYWKGEFPLDYVAQCCLYQVGIKEFIPGLNHSVLLIKCKDTARYLDFVIHYNQETDTVGIKEMTLSSGEKQVGNPYLMEFENFLAKVYAKFENVQWHLEHKSLPDRPYPFGTNFPCGYCSWEGTCWDGYGAELQGMEADVVFPDELADTARFYKELGAQESEIKKQKEGVKEDIKAAMKAQNARKGTAGEYELELKFQHREGYAVEATDFEMLYVKSAKRKDRKKT